MLHAITQGMKRAPFVLGLAYAGVILIGWPMLALCLLGLVDTAFGFARARSRANVVRLPFREH